MMRRLSYCGLLMLAAASDVLARGASPYIPLNLSPDLDRKIQRVLVLGDKPAMRRPYAAAVVLDALPKACARDRTLCEEVRAYLSRYMNKATIAHARVSAAAVDGEASAVLPNQHGLHVDSEWEGRAHAYYQPNDNLVIAAGVIAREDETIPTDSVVSFGWDFAQLDLGYRDHWLSPLNDSSSLISTQAPTMLSATLSNYEPISRFGFSYEVFAAQMSRHEGIVHPSGATAGKPRIAGLQIAVEPADGYALAASRITQYGGGARGGGGVSDFIDALTGASNQQNVAGDDLSGVNRVAALTSSILFQGRTPFAVHIEYAGEDNTYEGKYRLGATNLSLGLDFPSLGRSFDASFEASEWQNDWYVHTLYGLGLTHRGRVLGHWFGDNRLFGDAIGGASHMARVGWRVPRGDYLQAVYRALEFDSDWRGIDAVRPYETMRVLELSYSTSFSGHDLDAQLQVGEDIFGESFVRVGAAFDFARSAGARGQGDYQPDESSSTELFVDLGAQYSRVREFLLLQFRQRDTTAFEPNYHFGVGARRRASERSDLGVRLELDRVHGFNLWSLRAIDYRYRVGRKFAISAFAGAGRYDIELAAHGYYAGLGLQYRDVLPGWDVNLDYRRYDKLTRDKGLPSDPVSNPGLPRRVIDIHGFGLFVSKRW